MPSFLELYDGHVATKLPSYLWPFFFPSFPFQLYHVYSLKIFLRYINLLVASPVVQTTIGISYHSPFGGLSASLSYFMISVLLINIYLNGSRLWLGFQLCWINICNGIKKIVRAVPILYRVSLTIAYECLQQYWCYF